MKKVFSLRWQLILNNILIFILPTLIIGYFTISMYNHWAYENIQHENSIMASNINNQVNYFIQSQSTIMNGLRKNLLSRGNISNSELNKYLSTIINIYPLLANIQIVNKDGIIENTLPLYKSTIGTLTSNEESLNKIDKSGKPVWSHVFVSTLTHKPKLLIIL